MIRKIKHIKNIGVYKNFSWTSANTLSDFSQKNLIYGWNYSGKTTLSRLFGSLSSNEYLKFNQNSDFEMVLEDSKSIKLSDVPTDSAKIAVYNSDYIKNYLKIIEDEGLEPVEFDVGENVKARKELESTFEKIEKAKRVKDNLLKNQNPYENLSKTFTSFAKNVRNTYFRKMIEFNAGHMSRLIPKLNGDFESNLLDENEVERLSSIVTTTKSLSKISNSEEFSSLDNIKLEKIILNLNQIPEKKEVLNELEDNQALYDWVKDGLELHIGAQECTFCNNVLTEERIKLLSSYFLDEANVLKTNLNMNISSISKIIGELESYKLNVSESDLLESYHSEYRALEKKLKTSKKTILNSLGKLSKSLKDKIGNIDVTNTIDINLNNEITEFQGILNEFNDLYEKNDEAINSFSTIKSDSEKKLLNHLISEYLIDQNYEFKQFLNNCSIKNVSIVEDILKDYERRVKALEAKLKSTSAALKELNTYIQSLLSNKDLEIKETSTSKFRLFRKDIAASNLSEGEKTAITFSLFLVELEKMFKKGELIETIVFIDDPISSLDSNHIASVYSMINSFFFRTNIDQDKPTKICNCFKQLFISTHNFDFFSFLLDSKRLKKNDSKINPTDKMNCYFIKKLKTDESTIINLPSSLRKKTEYIYLYKLIEDFYLKGCDLDHDNVILMPNAIRRFLEMYTRIKLPGNDSELDERMNILLGDGHQVKALHHFSHMNSIEKLTKHDNLINILPKATRELFDLLKKDEVHYESLKSTG